MKILLLFIIASSVANATPAGMKGKDGHFSMTNKSLEHMGIKFEKLNGDGPWKVPLTSLVKIKLTQGVYRRFENEITFVIVKVLSTDQHSAYLRSDDLEDGDEVATSGVHFLRMTETDLNSETVDNCAH